MRVGATGGLAADVTLDADNTIVLAGSGPYTMHVPAAGIRTAQIADNNVTASKLPVALADKTLISSTSSTFASAGIAITPQTSSAYPTSNARPILVTFGPRYDGALTQFRVYGINPTVTFSLFCDGANTNPGGIQPYTWQPYQPSSALYYPVGQWGFSYLIPPGTLSAGSHSWSLNIANSGGSALHIDAALSVVEL